MNCRECQDWLQSCLDDGRIDVRADVRPHLAACKPCRRDLAAARVLLDGLASAPRTNSSKWLQASITAAVAAERVKRRRNSTYGWVGTLLLTAAVLALFFIGTFPASVNKPKTNAVAKIPEAAKAKEANVELAQRAEDAQKAVARLTRSVTEKTKSRLNVFLPKPRSLDVELPFFAGFEEPLDPAAKSLKAAGLTMAHALDPVAHTTMQAFDFFAREAPAFDFAKN